VLERPRRRAVIVLTRLTRRWPRFRPASSAAFRLADSLQHSRDPIRVVATLKTGSTIELDIRDQAQRNINLRGTLPDLTTVIQRFARPGWCVIDVGANAGYVSLTCADLGGPSSSIHAFEPQPDLAAMLRQSVRQNSSPITVVEAACGSTDGEIDLFRSVDPNWAALATVIPDHYSVSTDAVRVPLVKVDTYCTQNSVRPDFVKIDVEGFEAEVISGMIETLDRSSTPVFCEVSFGTPETPRVFEILSCLGYQGQTGDDWSREFRFPDDASAGRYQANILFVRQPKRHPR
jgi:FkbM family methyltransferase